MCHGETGAGGSLGAGQCQELRLETLPGRAPSSHTGELMEQEGENYMKGRESLNSRQTAARS